MQKIKVRNPWHSGLIISTALCVLFFLASLLWQAGHPHWAFVLMFGSLWLLTGLILANDGFNEESGLLLASVLDENVDFILTRIEELERTLVNQPKIK